MKKREPRIGVFVCHCGFNIAGSVDVNKVKEEALKIPGVVYATTYVFMCAQPGQNLLIEKIKEYNLNGVVVANCSPSLHELTFRNAAEKAGLNPYRVEIANIREQASWPHWDEPEKATKKAIEIVKITVEKVKKDIELKPTTAPVTKRALVIGGGIAGIQATLDIADAGYEVVLVEKNQSIGGHMAQLSETFPTLDCPQCILTPKMVAAGSHPNIKLYTYSEVEEITGFVGNFKVKIKKKARFVDWDKCTGCGACIEVCPKKVPSEFDLGLGKRKAVYTDFPQAVPNYPVIDPDACLFLRKGACRLCEKKCPVGAIKFDDRDEFVEEEVGAVIVTTGYELMDKKEMAEYGYGKYPDVLDALEFERLIAPTGPTFGKVIRPSDGKEPKSVAFIHCAGSRDPEHYWSYCSKICCMYIAKQALLYKHAVPDGVVYSFYIDIRAGGKGYEEFVERIRSEEDIVYIRGRVSRLFQVGDKIRLYAADTFTGEKVEVDVDMVVLAMAIRPSEGTFDIVKKLKLATDPYGFVQEAHPKLRPVETLMAGVFIAGAAQAPKDIPDSVAQASAAASKVVSLFSQDVIYHSPIVARVDTEVCAGCGLCRDSCAYDAIEIDLKKKIAKVNEVLCEGCGACSAVCPSGAMTLTNYTKHQIIDILDIATESWR